uniref:Gap junction protein n=1 Tax=Anabas testudineus TaxID=64144 RepID=A0A3Q1HBE7_ANATE
MGDWNFLGGILEEVHIHSTMVGKIWLTILFIFRMLVLGVAAEDVWNDEQSDFICNTDQPGCRNVCYDQAFPISLIRYWVLQVIFVSSPSLVYMGHAIYQLRALEKERHCKKVALRRELEAVDVELVEVRRRIEKEMRQLEQGKLNKAPLRGSLLCTYVAHIVTRSVVEVSFMMVQYILYGHRLSPLYKCEREPCPNVVDCFVSRPTEKSVFMMFMQIIACISLFLSLLEIIHLGYKKVKKAILGYYPHLKEDLDEYYVKSKKNSVVHQVCVGTSVGRKSTIPTAPSGYTLLLEKQGNGPNYPLLSTSSAFVPIQGDPSAKPDFHKDCKEGVPSPTEQNSNSNNTSSETRSPADKQDEPEEPSSPHHEDLEKSRRVSPPWNCSTVMEGTGSDSGDSRSQSPDSAGELSSVSRHSRESNSPTTSSPNRRVSAASSASSRRAPTDLQI